MDLTTQIERLQQEVDSLREAFSIFEGLAAPRMAKLYQQMVGGLTVVASDADWRMHGFFASEGEFAWTRFDENVAVYMLLLSGESYYCTLCLVRTPHIEAPGSVVIRANGEEVQSVYDEDGQVYNFKFSAQRTGWHPFSFNARECLEPSLHGSQDSRRLGVLFRSLSLTPVTPRA